MAVSDSETDRRPDFFAAVAAVEKLSESDQRQDLFVDNEAARASLIYSPLVARNFNNLFLKRLSECVHVNLSGICMFGTLQTSRFDYIVTWLSQDSSESHLFA